MGETVDNVRLEETANGSVSFASDVVATIAGLAAAEVEGVASMVTPNGGFAEMISRRMGGAQNKSFTKGVKIEMNGTDVTAEISFIVEYGMPIPKVAADMQESVKKAIETMTGLNVTRVDIHVTGISFEKENRESAALESGMNAEIAESVEEPAKTEPAEEPAETMDIFEEDNVDLEEPAAEEAAEDEAPVE